MTNSSDTQSEPAGAALSVLQSILSASDEELDLLLRVISAERDRRAGKAASVDLEAREARRILEALSEEPDGLTSADLARRTGGRHHYPLHRRVRKSLWQAGQITKQSISTNGRPKEIWLPV